jgi:RHS repeat-associated protein
MGNRTSVLDRNGKTTGYQYDGLSRLRKITDANNGITIYDYDKVGNRTLIVDANGNETEYEYDQYNRMTKEIFDDLSYISYNYSIEGDLKKRETYNSSNVLQKTQDFSYDNGHRLTNDGIYSYSFSCACGKLGSVTGPDGTASYEYDYKGRVKKTTYNDGTIVENLFLESSKQKVVKMDNVTLFIINLDGEGRASGSNAVVERVVPSAQNLFAMSRDNGGRLTWVGYPNKDSSSTEYDAEGRIKKHRNYYDEKMINKFEETLDPEGNKLHEKTNVGTRNYGYDNIYQLTSAAYERNQAYTWSYDAAGNRETAIEPIFAASQSYTPNNLNQYTSINSVNYSYDSDGNLLSDGTRSFTWDYKNRLTGINNQGTEVSYKYDHNDLRVEKTAGNTTTSYFYDGNLLLAEKVGNQIQKIYINDGTGIVGIVRPIYNESETLTHYQRLYFLYDSLGSVSCITGENGLPLQNYTYSPFGTCLNVTNDPINSLQFIGRYGGYLDSDTGLTYFWHRWYDSKDGRWISRDPLQDTGYQSIGYCGSCGNDYSGSFDDSIYTNNGLYVYAFNNPLLYIDSNGLEGNIGGDDPGFDNPDGAIREINEQLRELEKKCRSGELKASECAKERRRLLDRKRELERKKSKRQQHHCEIEWPDMSPAPSSPPPPWWILIPIFIILLPAGV